MKRIQKSLLRLLGPNLESKLIPEVFGATTAVKAPTFSNALQHAHSAVLVSFDIKDFFPSTSINQVLKGIRFGSGTRRKMVTAGLLPERFAGSKQCRDIDWSHDAEILVARLGTYRGRLPQGSPLSPLLANVAFAPCDYGIIGQLAKRFGSAGYRYSRYFDDITISLINPSSMRACSASDFRDECEKILLRALQNTSYTLKSEKTRWTSLRRSPDINSGHKVTGLFVRGGSVTLTRKTRRKLRAILHNLETLGFVDAASRWYQQSERGRLEFQSLTKGHIWKHRRGRRRRLSAEKMACTVLRNFYPDLQVERLMVEWHGWQEMYDPKFTQTGGKEVAVLVSRLLAAAWQGSVSIEKDSDKPNEVLVKQAGVPVARLLAESELDFFLLNKRTAIAVVEFWHFLSGYKHFLQACPREVEFSEIRSFAAKLDDAFSNLEICRKEGHLASTDPKGQQQPENDRDRILRNSRLVSERYRDYVRILGCKQERAWFVSRFDLLDQDVATNQEFDEWVTNFAELFLKLPMRPSCDPVNSIWETKEFYEYLRVKRDLQNGRILPKYSITQQFEPSDLGMCKRSLNQFQQRLLLYAKSLFDLDTKQRNDLGFEEWKSALLSNPEAEKLEVRILAKATEFLKAIDGSCSEQSGTNFLDPQSAENFCDIGIHRNITKRDFDLSSNDAWKSMADVAREVFISIKDSINPQAFELLPVGTIEMCKRRHARILDSQLTKKRTPRVEWESVTVPREAKRNELNKAIKAQLVPSARSGIGLFENLRHRSAHGQDAAKRADWVEVQNKVAKLLGRQWRSTSGKKHPKFHAPDDLEITGYEAAQVWSYCLDCLIAYLAEAQRFIQEGKI